MTSFLIITITVLAVNAIIAAICIRRYCRRFRRAYKSLMVQIIQCNDFAQLCAIELKVDKFYELAYVHRPQQIAAWACNLYSAINERTQEFTGTVPERKEGIGQLLKG